jgi:hypothetical protein
MQAALKEEKKKKETETKKATSDATNKLRVAKNIINTKY